MIRTENILLISVTLEVFHLSIPDNNSKLAHPSKILFILIILEVFHLDRSGNDVKDAHPLNIQHILVMLELIKKDNEFPLGKISLLIVKFDLDLLFTEEIGVVGILFSSFNKFIFSSFELKKSLYISSINFEDKLLLLLISVILELLN